MKIIKCITNAIFIAAFSISMLSAQSTAGVITTTSEITVKPGHHAQFVEGIKIWKECYLENNGQRKWGMWKRVQGAGNVYVMVGTMDNWAGMDKDDPVNASCYATFLNLIAPHVDKVDYNISQVMPDISRTWPADSKHAWVTYFKVKNRFTFKEVINAVGESIQEKEGSFRGLWREFKGGSIDAPDFMVATPYKAFADLDITRDRPGKIYTDAVGEDKANEMWVKWYDTVEDSWSFLYKLDSELSN